jgi:hybrid cluster-associated redox disulfide protein
MADPSAAPVGADMLVADVMQRWPSTATVFLRHGMACPGCPMAPFMTVGEAAASYRIPLDRLVADLCMAVPRARAESRP